MMFAGTGRPSLRLCLGWNPLKCSLACDILTCNPDLTSLECVPTRNPLSSFHLWLISSYLIHSITMLKSSKASHGPKTVHVYHASRHPPSWSVKTETIPAPHQVHNGLCHHLAYWYVVSFLSPPLSSCNIHYTLCHLFATDVLFFPLFCSRKIPSHICLISLDPFTFQLVCLLYQSKGSGLFLLNIFNWLIAIIPLPPPCWLSHKQPDIPLLQQAYIESALYAQFWWCGTYRKYKI